MECLPLKTRHVDANSFVDVPAFCLQVAAVVAAVAAVLTVLLVAAVNLTYPDYLISILKSGSSAWVRVVLLVFALELAFQMV